MGIARGANIITNGLVFGYDTGYPLVSSTSDAYRFNKGKPTTNLLSNSGASSLDVRTDIYNNVTKTNLGNGKFRFANDGTGGSTIRLYCNLSDLTDGATYGCSVSYENFQSGVGDNVTLDWCDQNNTTFSGTSGRAQMSASRSSYTNTYRFLDISIPISSSIDLFDAQVELTSCSPFVSSTRSISGSLLDIIGSQQIKLTQVSYDSNAQLTFDGTDDYAEIPSFFVPTGSRSVEVVAMVASASTDSNQKHIFANSDQPGNGTGDAGIAILYRNGHFRGYIWNWDGANSPRTEKVFQTNVEQDKFYHLVLTHENSEAKFYTNGVLVESALCTGSRFPSNDTTIGRYSPGYSQGFNGDIPIVRVYNRSITSDEVAQNFNSIKERFDI